MEISFCPPICIPMNVALLHTEITTSLVSHHSNLDLSFTSVPGQNDECGNEKKENDLQMILSHDLSPFKISLSTMVENRKKKQNSHPIIHCPTSKGLSKLSAAERASEASYAERINEQCEQTSE